MKRLKKNRFLIICHAIMAFISVTMVVPFVLLIISSFTSETAAVKYGYSFIPKEWSIAAYQYVLKNWQLYGKAYLITICVTAAGIFFGVLFSALMGYVLSCKDVPGNKILMAYVMFTMLFNGGLVAAYINYVQVFHIKNTYWGLLIPNLLCKAFSIVMLKNYFQTSVPGELNEAARIDGASEFAIFFRIVAPLSKPILATVALITGLAYWNDWQNGLYFLDDPSMHGIQNILNNINSSAQYLMQFGSGVEGTIPTTTARMAVAVIGILPILLIYPFFQEFFAKGLTAGAVKG